MSESALILLLALATPQAAPPQPPAEVHLDPQDGPPDKRDEVKALLEELADLVGESGREDPGDRKAIAIIGRLKSEFRRSGPSDKGHIIRGLERVMLARRKARKDGSQETAMFIEAARGLGGMGEDAAKPLLKWVDNRRHRDDLALQSELILSLGRTRAAVARKALSKMLKDRRPTFLRAAATGLGNFTNEPSKVRKEIFKDLLKAILQAQSNAQGQDSTAQQIWSALNGAATSSMRKLSGGNAGSPEAWQHWWNKNKRRNWDA